jgi:hypothetical protein
MPKKGVVTYGKNKHPEDRFVKWNRGEFRVATKATVVFTLLRYHEDKDIYEFIRSSRSARKLAKFRLRVAKRYDKGLTEEFLNREFPIIAAELL